MSVLRADHPVSYSQDGKGVANLATYRTPQVSHPNQPAFTYYCRKLVAIAIQRIHHSMCRVDDATSA